MHIFNIFDLKFPANPYSLLAKAVISLYPDFAVKPKVPPLSIVFEVQMTELVGEYDSPDNTPEWEWIEANASYSNSSNGSDGVWEFILNVANFDEEYNGCEDAPEAIQHLIKNAIENDYSYILIHQGT